MSTPTGIYPGKRLRSLYRRVLAYCSEHGIRIPTGFADRNTYKFVLIDIGATPPKLIATSWYLPSDVLHYLASHQARDRTYRVLDFKSGWELRPINGKLVRVEKFNHHPDADYIFDFKDSQGEA